MADLPDMYDALLGSQQQLDPAALANALRQKQALGTVAALTGISGLQKLGPQMINEAASGAQDYATLRDRTQNQQLQRALQAHQIKQSSQDRQDATDERRQAAADRDALLRATLGSKQETPSYRDIIDPKDPTRLITIDGKLYKPGSTLGDPGVVGVAGKEPTKAKADETRGTGQAAVSDTVTQLKDLYDQLDKNGDITSTSSGGLSNSVAAIESSGLGQGFGKLFGTKSQSLRNQINQSRPLLLQAIKQATGMSSKQMDSNAELKFYLSAATDPTLDVQANRKALEHLDKLYGLSGQSTTVNTSPAAAPTALPPGAPPGANPADYAPAVAPGNAPMGAIEMLKRNPALAPAFKAKYGYLPSGG